MTTGRAKKVTQKLPNFIHLVDGEKGGAGKTLFARALVQWFLDKGINFQAVETDRSNPDLLSVYQAVTKVAIFSESEKLSGKADVIFQYATETPVVVNLPAQAYRPVSDWIFRNEILEVGKEYNVGICKWFISTGSFDSLELFKASLRKFEGKIPHVLVKNLYFRDRWDSVLEQAELKNLLDHYQVKQVDFPKLGFDERDLIDQHKLTFSAALEGSQLSILQKTRVRGFLREIYEAIEATGPVPVASIAGKANTEEKPSE